MKVMNLTNMSKYIDINKRTLHRMIKDGRFPVEPIKGTQPRLWNTADIDKWLAGGG